MKGSTNFIALEAASASVPVPMWAALDLAAGHWAHED
jgi:hypothetical protein